MDLDKNAIFCLCIIVNIKCKYAVYEYIHFIVRLNEHSKDIMIENLVCIHKNASANRFSLCNNGD